MLFLELFFILCAVFSFALFVLAIMGLLIFIVFDADMATGLTVETFLLSMALLTPSALFFAGRLT